MCRSSKACRYAALKVCVTLKYACLAPLEQCMQVQAAQRESVESSQEVRGLEEHLAELQQKLSLSAQAKTAARLDTSKARPLPSCSMALMPCTPAVLASFTSPSLLTTSTAAERAVLMLQSEGGSVKAVRQEPCIIIEVSILINAPMLAHRSR